MAFALAQSADDAAHARINATMEKRREQKFHSFSAKKADRDNARRVNQYDLRQSTRR